MPELGEYEWPTMHRFLLKEARVEVEGPADKANRAEVVVSDSSDEEEADDGDEVSSRGAAEGWVRVVAPFPPSHSLFLSWLQPNTAAASVSSQDGAVEQQPPPPPATTDGQAPTAPQDLPQLFVMDVEWVRGLFDGTRWRQLTTAAARELPGKFLVRLAAVNQVR